MLQPVRAKTGITSLRNVTGGVTPEFATATGTSTANPACRTASAVIPSAAGASDTAPPSTRSTDAKAASAGANSARWVTSRVVPSDSVSTAITACRSRAESRFTSGG